MSSAVFAPPTRVHEPEAAAWCHSRRPSFPESSLQAAANRSSFAEPGRRKHSYPDVVLRYGCDRVERTKHAAVFVVSPSARCRRRRARTEGELRRVRTGSSRSAHQTFKEDAQMELGRIRAAWPLRGRRSSRSEVVPPADASVDSEEEEDTGDSSSDSDSDSDDASMAEEAGGNGGSSSSDHEVDEAERLKTGVQRRAAEQTMMANVKQLMTKQQIRYGSMQDSPSARGRCRQEVTEEATRFNKLYSETIDILEANMTLRPPRRRHTLDMTVLREEDP
eukprot:gnl/TRDRNA2_/TRDRNA2_177502_c7_seq14.p1 gnl/TRDRNA2_/TRDRNA2_177502_c7~~gnl/TRDRNA2_/TRDRNA2_177502_c7_seq14.p1  ORF type:complete len:321 (+),score=61.54 gnl/TRDRNA2_/TRDRNA2_177502_c7_seq14:132-965(+)